MINPSTHYNESQLAPYNADLSGLIARSRQRCRSLGLQSASISHNEPVPAGALAQARERNAGLLRLVAPELDTLLHAMDSAGGLVLLTDRDGLILDVRGEPTFMHRARRVALLPGAEWSEHREGTNAIGTAIAEGCFVEVLGDQHFLQANHFLVCTAMPIQDAQGQLAGVLDISGDVRMAHPHTRMLVYLAVANLEHRWALQTAAQGDLRVQLHAHPAWLGTPHEGLLVFRDGRLVGSNRVGRALLGINARGVERSWESLFSFADNPGDYRAQVPRSGQCLHIRVRSTSRARGPKPVSPAAHRTQVESPPERTVESSVRFADGMIWDSATTPLRAKAARALAADIPILLHGETGSGKDLFVRALHAQSARAGKPLVALNCAALPESLFEAELFGYTSGAFTGARREGSPGRLRQAHGGGLFLDEIGDLPLGLQARLLRVLQDRQVQPLGGGKAHEVDFRLVTATHKPLQEEVAAGRFRADLYYRIRHLVLTLPPLRERPELSAIVEALLMQLGCAERGVRFTAEAHAYLLAHRWPGNFRELFNVLNTLVALADDGTVLGPADLPPEVVESASREVIHAPLKQTEDDLIQQVLAACQGNVSAAARQLGIHRTTLHRKLKRTKAE